jgi:hypothetical protein
MFKCRCCKELLPKSDFSPSMLGKRCKVCEKLRKRGLKPEPERLDPSSQALRSVKL